MSSRGYGMFTHTSAPLTYDFGSSYDGAATIYSGDDSLDLFFFLRNAERNTVRIYGVYREKAPCRRYGRSASG